MSDLERFIKLGKEAIVAFSGLPETWPCSNLAVRAAALANPPPTTKWDRKPWDAWTDDTGEICRDYYELPSYVAVIDKACRKWAVALNFGMDRFGVPSECAHLELDSEIVAQAKKILYTKNAGGEWDDVPPFFHSIIIVLAFAKYSLSTVRLPIIPSRLKIHVHGKEVDVWEKFSRNYMNLVFLQND